MKRTISFVMALVMCCSLLLSALPAARAVSMNFLPEDPDLIPPEKKMALSLLEQMVGKADDEEVFLNLFIRGLSEAELAALIPLPKPGEYASSEEITAYARAEHDLKQRLYPRMVDDFVQRYLDDTARVGYKFYEALPGFQGYVRKSDIPRLLALDEVVWLNYAQSIYLVKEPAVSDKIAAPLLEYMQTAAEDEKIPVRLMLRGPISQEIEALAPVSYPTMDATVEDIQAYRDARTRAGQEFQLDRYGTFARNHLDENDEILYTPGNVKIPVMVVKTTRARIAALAGLRFVSQIDPAFGYDEAFPDPELPEDPATLEKLNVRLREFMTVADHNELIPISITLKTPTSINSITDRAEKLAAFKLLTAEFVADRLDETDEVFVRSTNSVWASVPKYKIAQLAALEDVTSIGWIPEHNDPVYPASGEAVYLSDGAAQEPALSDKIEWVLQVQMTATADDTPIRVEIDLDAPTLQDIKAANPAPEHMTLAEYAAYTDSLNQKYAQARAAVYEPFVQNYLNTAEEQVKAPENYYILATLSKTKIAALARLDEVKSILMAGGDSLVPVIPLAEPGEQVVPEKIEAGLQREMNGAADDEIIRILLWLNVPSNKEIDATVPPPEDPTDPEQVEAFISAAYRARQETVCGILESFVEEHMKGTNELLGAGFNGRYLLAATTKSRILSFTAQDEVRRIEQYGIPAFPGDDDPPQVPKVDPEPPVDSEVLKKLDTDLIEQMEKASDDVMIPIAVYLDSPSPAEIEAMVPIPQPDVYSAVTMEEVNAYIHAKRAVAWEVYSAITTAFVEDHLDENDTIRYRGKAIPVVNCDVPKSKILSLAALEEVLDIGYFPNVTLYPTWIRDESEIVNKLTAPLKAYMENLADEEPVTICVDLRMPSEEIMERIVSVPKPGEDASQEEIDAYNEAYRQTWREQVSLRTDGFMHLYVRETDPVYYIGEDDATVICEIPVARLRSVASYQSVTQIGLAGQLDDPAPVAPEVAKKLSAYLLEYMADKPDDTIIPISIWLAEPTQEEIDAMVPVSVPGASATLQEVNAYIAAKRKVEKEVISGITDAFAQNHLDETDVIYFKGKFIPNVVVEVPKAKILSLAELNEVTHINAVFDHDQIAYGQDGEPVDPSVRCEHEYKTAVTAPTCTEAGFTTYTCDRCGDSYWDTEVPALGHSFGEWTDSKAATCTEKGEQTRTCTRCEAKEIRETDALGHDYRDGVCTRCGAADPNYVPPVNYDQLKAVIAEAEMLNLNDYYYTSATADAFYAALENARAALESDSQDEVDAAAVALMRVIPAKALNWTELNELSALVREAERNPDLYTAESFRTFMDLTAEVGLDDMVAAESQEELDRAAQKLRAALAALEEKHVHAYTDVVTAPTCTEAGFTIHTCACGESYVDSEVPALGHSFGEWAVTIAATCTAEGEETRTCAACGEKETRKLDKIAHDYKDGKCTACGEADPDYKPPFRFDDVKDDKAFYFAPVYWAVDKGVTKGTTSTTFSPDNACTRAQVVTMLWRASGSRKPERDENPFKDVTKDDYYYDAVLWAVEQGITNGVSETAFGPDRTCTRAQIVTFIWRWFGENDPHGNDGVLPDAFEDVADDAYYADAVAWAVKLNITSGTTPTTFRPDQVCTRGQIVTFLWRAWFARRVDLPE